MRRFLPGPAPGTFVLVCATVAALLASPRPAHAQATVRVSGEPGEYVTGGATFSYSSADVTFGFVRMPGGVGLNVAAPALWSFRFLGATQHDLGSGVFSPQTLSPTGNEPSLWVDHASQGCSLLGDFEVRRLSFRPDGTVREAWITWTARCQSPGPRQFGEIRLAADTTLWQSHPGDVWAFEGDSVSFVTVARHAQGLAVRFVADAPPVGATFFDLGNGSARFGWRAPAVSTPTVYPIRLIATDDLGASDTTTTWVHSMPAFRVGYRSDPGDGIGKGVPDTLRDPRTEVIIRESGMVYPPLSCVFNVGGRRWTFEYQAPFHRKLAEGTYEGAQRSPSSTLVRPGFGVSTLLGISGCQDREGRFEIRRLRRNATGAVTGIWAVMDARCVGSVGRFRGELLYDIDTTLYLRAPADVFAEPGDSIRIAVAVVETAGRPATLDFSALPAGAAFTWDGPASGMLRWRAPASPVTELPVTFYAASDAGGRDTVTTYLHVVPPDRFILVGEPNHCDYPGKSFVGSARDGEIVPYATYDYETRVKYTSPNQSLGLWLSMPSGQSIRAGQYPLCRSSAFEQNLLWPGFVTDIDFQGYAPELADFHIRKFRRKPSGETASLWATWNWSCWWTPGHPQAHGEVRFNADTTLYTEAPAFWLVERGRPVHFGVRAVQAFGAPSQVTGTQLPPSANFTPGAGATGVFDWAVATPLGATPATFVSSDNAGNADTVQTLIRVMEPRHLRVDGEQYDWATSGGHYECDATTGNFVPANDGHGWVSFSVYALTDSWTIRFGAPGDRTLTPGVYAHPVNASVYSPKRSPEMSIIRNSNQSSPSGQGEFHVRKLALGADGRPTQMWARFRTGYPGSQVWGEVLYGDPDTTIYLTAPADLFVNPSDSVGFVVRATHARSRPVVLSAPGAPAGCLFSDRGDGSATFAWFAPPVGGVDVPVMVFARDDEGRVDSCVTVLHVVVPSSLSVTSTEYEQTLRGESYATDSRSSDFQLNAYGEHGAGIQVQDTNGLWYLWFAAPQDQLLQPGSYPDAIGLNAWDPSLPTLEVRHGADGCGGNGTGTFRVLDVGYDANGHIQRLWVVFEQRCYPWAPSITGELRLGVSEFAVPALASRRVASGADGVARLAWRLDAAAGTLLRVDRRDAGSATWNARAELRPDGSGDVAFADLDVRPGASYGFRLVEPGATETVLDELTLVVAPLIPFEIAALGPNPVRSRLVLHTRGRIPGEVDVLVTDVGGRSVAHETLRPTDEAQHEISLSLPGSLRPGVYLLRARAGGRSVTRRFVLVR